MLPKANSFLKCLIHVLYNTTMGGKGGREWRRKKGGRGREWRRVECFLGCPRWHLHPTSSCLLKIRYLLCVWLPRSERVSVPASLSLWRNSCKLLTLWRFSVRGPLYVPKWKYQVSKTVFRVSPLVPFGDTPLRLLGGAGIHWDWWAEGGKWGSFSLAIFCLYAAPA